MVHNPSIGFLRRGLQMAVVCILSFFLVDCADLLFLCMAFSVGTYFKIKPTLHLFKGNCAIFLFTLFACQFIKEILHNTPTMYT